MTTITHTPAPIRPRGRHTAARTLRREIVEHHDIAVRDWGLDVIQGRDVSHRRCAGGPECFHTLPATPMSLPGATLALAVAAATTLLLGRN